MFKIPSKLPWKSFERAKNNGLAWFQFVKFSTNNENKSLTLSGEHIVISGGAGALGKPIVKELLNCGAKVSVGDKLTSNEFNNIFENELLLHQCNDDMDMNDSSLYCDYLDICNEQSIDTFLSNCISKHGNINTSCIHAGVVQVTPVLDVSLSEFRNIIDINVIGSFLFAQKCAIHMRDSNSNNNNKNNKNNGGGGHLLFTSSWVSQHTWPGLIHYAASKSAINNMMKTFALELAQYNIRSNAICPGMVDAGMARDYYEKHQPYHDCVDTSIPLKHMQPIKSIIDTWVFMCSNKSNYMTGTVITVDGGSSLTNKHTVPIFYGKNFVQ